MKSKEYSKLKLGFSLLEAIIALSFWTIISTILISLIYTKNYDESRRIAFYKQESHLVNLINDTNLTNEKKEIVSSDNDFLNIETIEEIDNDLWIINAESKLKEQTNISSSSISFPINYLKEGMKIKPQKVCNILNENKLRNLKFINEFSFNISGITKIEAREPYLFISLDSNKTNDSDLIVLDVKNKENILVADEINTGSGISDFVLTKDHIISSYSGSALSGQVINIRDPQNIYIVNQFATALPFATATRGYASSIALDFPYLYLGTEKWIGNELEVFYLNNLSDIKNLYSFDINNKIEDILVDKNRLYIAKAGKDEFMSIDKNLLNEGILSYNSFSFKGHETQETLSLLYTPQKIWLMRSSGGFNNSNNPELISIQKDTEEIIQNIDWGSSIYRAINKSEDIVFVSGSTSAPVRLLNTDNRLSEISIPDKQKIVSISCDLSFVYFAGIKDIFIYQIEK